MCTYILEFSSLFQTAQAKEPQYFLYILLHSLPTKVFEIGK